MKYIKLCDEVRLNYHDNLDVKSLIKLWIICLEGLVEIVSEINRDLVFDLKLIFEAWFPFFEFVQNKSHF